MYQHCQVYQYIQPLPLAPADVATTSAVTARCRIQTPKKLLHQTLREDAVQNISVSPAHLPIARQAVTNCTHLHPRPSTSISSNLNEFTDGQKGQKCEKKSNDADKQLLLDEPLEIDCWNTAVTGWEQASLIKSKIGLIIGGRYKVVQSIASGSYGEIFAAEDLQSPESKRHRVAVKFDAACRDNHLMYEYQVYKSALYNDGRGKVEGFPQVYWYGHEFGHNIMVMELLGAPIASLFAFCGRKFGKQTILDIGDQMIKRIRHLHQRGFIHRDIKPENFLMGLDDKEHICHLIDFGLARRYRYRENRELRHIPFRRGRFFVGTAKYASLNSHKNIELSRRDDLESLAYVLIELINGILPWKHISKHTKHHSSQRIRAAKEQINWADQCPPMADFVRYCREIPFNEEPNYDFLLHMLHGIILPDENSLIHSTGISPRNTFKTKPSTSSQDFCPCQQRVNKKHRHKIPTKQVSDKNEMLLAIVPTASGFDVALRADVASRAQINSPNKTNETDKSNEPPRQDKKTIEASEAIVPVSNPDFYMSGITTSKNEFSVPNDHLNTTLSMLEVNEALAVQNTTEQSLLEDRCLNESDFNDRNTTTTSSTPPSPEPVNDLEHPTTCISSAFADTDDMADDEADDDEEVPVQNQFKEHAAEIKKNLISLAGRHEDVFCNNCKKRRIKNVEHMETNAVIPSTSIAEATHANKCPVQIPTTNIETATTKHPQYSEASISNCKYTWEILKASDQEQASQYLRRFGWTTNMEATAINECKDQKETQQRHQKQPAHPLPSRQISHPIILPDTSKPPPPICILPPPQQMVLKNGAYTKPPMVGMQQYVPPAQQFSLSPNIGPSKMASNVVPVPTTIPKHFMSPPPYFAHRPTMFQPQSQIQTPMSIPATSVEMCIHGSASPKGMYSPPHAHVPQPQVQVSTNTIVPPTHGQYLPISQQQHHGIIPAQERMRIAVQPQVGMIPQPQQVYLLMRHPAPAFAHFGHGILIPHSQQFPLRVLPNQQMVPLQMPPTINGPGFLSPSNSNRCG